MKRCTNCFRYSAGDPAYCTQCGRSYNVRICARGHVNSRRVQFCAECGSADLSTPAPAAGFLFTLSDWALKGTFSLFVVLAAASLILSLLHSIDWTAISPRLSLLLLMLGFLYWTTTLLPGPIRRIGSAAGRQAWKAVTKTKRKERK